MTAEFIYVEPATTARVLQLIVEHRNREPSCKTGMQDDIQHEKLDIMGALGHCAAGQIAAPK